MKLPCFVCAWVRTGSEIMTGYEFIAVSCD